MGNEEELVLYRKLIGSLDQTTDGYFYIYDISGDCLYFTEKIREKFPLPDSGDGGIRLRDWEQIVCPRDRRQLEADMERIRTGDGQAHDMEYRLVDRQGNLVWIKCRGTLQPDSTGCPSVLFGSVCEMASDHSVDSLTGLWNYDKFMDDMGKCLNQSDGCLMVLGIDDFKHINVKNGRTYGNYILKQTAEILEEAGEYPLRLYRLAGDCFAVIFPKKTREEVQEFYAAVKERLEQYCTLSAGVAVYEKAGGMDGGSVYQHAENALDQAKKEGKNTLIFFSSDHYQKNLDQIQLLDEIKQSVAEGFRGFYLCYQPQIDSRSFELYGAEALLRYESAERGAVGPGEFIPLLEQSGLICEVGLWALKTAAAQCVKWRRTLPGFHISVNISYVQLRRDEIGDDVLNILRETDLPGDALTLEVTESMQLQDYSYYNKIFYDWKRRGIQIAIDDFGTGYSSLSYLKSIDIDETKIDRCFVTRIQKNAYNYKLLDNMIQLAHSAQIRVCCEGVETEDELMALKKLNPDVLQGYLFAKPCKKEEFEQEYLSGTSRAYENRIQNVIKSQAHLSDKDGERAWELFSDGDYEEILDHTNLGLWRICINKEEGRYELYADPVMLRIMGVEEQLSPDECYFHWYDRINDGYYNYINLAIESAIETGKITQVEYTWNHPTKGEVTVRCMIIRMREQDDTIWLEGYHRIISDLVRPDFLPGGIKSELFEYNEKKHAIYFHTKRKMIAGDRIREENFPECWIRRQIVHPHFAEEFRRLFQDIQNQWNCAGSELLFRTKSGAYEWFKVKTRHLSDKKEDVHTVAVLMDPADQERAIELEYMKKSDFYRALLSETVAHAEVDVESGYIMEAEGLWASCMKESREKNVNFDRIVELQLNRHVIFPEDMELYKKHMNLQYMKEMYKMGIPTMELCFRRCMGGKLCWMKLVIHVFQDRYTENMYALLYLKNIDAEKRRELATEKAAQSDPLTRVYNRTVFEKEVSDYMASEEGEARGALIILDLDDFKQVNDQYGHLRGDEALKTLAEVLRHTFRSHDLIGRLGGDEFLVFVKGIEKKEILDRRMEQLFSRLNTSCGSILACSAGICFVTGEGFCYDEALKRADTALYESKKRGKNRYSYYGEMKKTED